MKTKNLSAPTNRSYDPALMVGVNLTIHPIFVQPVAAESIVAPTIGTPIMREDFVTDTGFLVGADTSF